MHSYVSSKDIGFFSENQILSLNYSCQNHAPVHLIVVFLIKFLYMEKKEKANFFVQVDTVFEFHHLRELKIKKIDVLYLKCL
jgi:hypothetical protein